MTRPALLKLLFNATGVLIGIILVSYIVYSAVDTDADETCSARYPTTTQLSLRSAKGELLSPIELQARAGLLEWGVANNAAVVPQGADGTALQIKLATLTEIEGGVKRATNGVHFNWRLAAMQDATSACLSYSVWLPKGFSFEDGGVLPGLIGNVPGESDDASRFATRVRWESNGRAELDAALPGSTFRAADRDGAPLSSGKWTRIDQEIVLNSPDKADGSARMWIDGRQASENTKLMLRKNADVRFLGVHADIGYLRDPKKSGELRLTPFQLSWR